MKKFGWKKITAACLAIILIGTAVMFPRNKNSVETVFSSKRGMVGKTEELYL